MSVVETLMHVLATHCSRPHSSKYFRQTITSSSYAFPELLKMTNKDCTNIFGNCLITKRGPSALQSVRTGVRQVSLAGLGVACPRLILRNAPGICPLRMRCARAGAGSSFQGVHDQGEWHQTSAPRTIRISPLLSFHRYCRISCDRQSVRRRCSSSCHHTLTFCA